MRPERGVAVIFLRALLDSGARFGVEPTTVLDRLGLARDALDDQNAWISVETMTRAWELVPELSNDPDFGLHAAETTPTGAYGVLEYATITSPTAAVALARVERYYRLISGMSDIRFERDGTHARISLKPVAGGERNLRHYTEHFFTLLATRLSILTLDKASPLAIDFAHAAPSTTTEHERVFGAKVRFSRPHAEILFEDAALDVPLTTSNAALAGVLAQTEQMLTTPAAVTVAERVRRELPAALSTGDYRLSAIAKRLGLGARTLEQKLDEENESFNGLVDDVRKELALTCVRENKMSLGEIAFVLGFTQTSTFHRAFKRWTGTTPRDYRSAPPKGA